MSNKAQPTRLYKPTSNDVDEWVLWILFCTAEFYCTHYNFHRKHWTHAHCKICRMRDSILDVVMGAVNQLDPSGRMRQNEWATKRQQ